MTENATENPMYLVPGRLTSEQETSMRSELLGAPVLGCADMFTRMVGIVGAPIQPCVDVETVGYVSAEDIRNRHRYKVSISAIQSGIRNAALVRRTDMDAQVARVAAEKDTEITRLLGLFGQMADILTRGRVDMRSLMACRKYVAAALNEGTAA